MQEFPNLIYINSYQTVANAIEQVENCKTLLKLKTISLGISEDKKEMGQAVVAHAKRLGYKVSLDINRAGARFVKLELTLKRGP